VARTYITASNEVCSCHRSKSR